MDKQLGPQPVQAPSRQHGSWTGLQLLVVALCVAVNMLDGMDVLAMSYVAPTLQAEWHMGSERMGLIFSAAIAGMALGSLVIAPLADRYGRRPLVLASLALSSCAMLLSGLADNAAQLMVLRALVGIGIGSVLPTMAALVAEYAPEANRTFSVCLLYAGYPLGAMLAGFVGTWAIPLHGWRAMLVGVGAVSLATCPLLWALLPESTQYQRLRGMDLPGASGTASEPGPWQGETGIRGLFSEGRAPGTLLLWSATISGFMALWFVISWTPKLAQIAGLDGAQGILAGTLFNVGALLGTIALGWLSRKLPLHRLIALFLLPAALAMTALGALRMPAMSFLVTVLAMGILLQGGFNGIYPLAARLYPAAVRSTGIGWATGMGRIGAVVGPALGGMLIETQVSLWMICTVFAAPAALAGLCAARVAPPLARTQ